MAVSQKDIERLRALAEQKLALANSPENDAILRKWKAQAAGRREEPIVRLLFSNFTDQVVGCRLQCEDPFARNVEARLLSDMVGRELFGDDTPLAPTYEVELTTGASPFGTKPVQHRVPGSIGFHIDPVTDDIEADFHLFEGGSFYADRKGTDEYAARVDELIGDILPSRIVMNNLNGAMTNPLVMLIGMETYYLSMYDAPDTLHRIMEMATQVYEAWYDHLEKEHLLLPTNGISPIQQESFAFTDELPADKAETTKDCWGFLESQETTAVSTETYGEFVYPYLDRLVRRYGLLSYGCCERVDHLWEKYLSKWTNLRKLSVSPFGDGRRVGELLRGTRCVFYSKPRAEHVTAPGPLNEDLIRDYFKGVGEEASGCLLEVAQREVGTIYGDPERGRRYVQLAREGLSEGWKP